MANGTSWLTHMWSGTVYQALLVMKHPETLHYQTNKEGVPVGSDTMVVLKNAPHPNTAQLFLNWMLRARELLAERQADRLSDDDHGRPEDLRRSDEEVSVAQGHDRRGGARPEVQAAGSEDPAALDHRLVEDPGVRQQHPVRRGLWSSFLVPPGLWLVALYLVPLGLIVAASFGTVDFLGRVIYSWPFSGWDLSNYHTVLSSAYLPAFFRSLAFAALATLLCLLVGYPVAYVIARYGGRVRHLLVVLLVLPWFVDYLIRVYAWIVLLGDNGVVNGWLGDLGMKRRSAHPVPGHVVGRRRRPVLQLLPVHGAAGLRGRRSHGLLPRRGGQGSLRHALADVPLRHVPGDVPGCRGRSRARVPAGVGRLRERRVPRLAETSMIGNVINGTFNQGGYVPLGGTLTVCFMVGIAAFMVFYLRSASRASREGAL